LIPEWHRGNPRGNFEWTQTEHFNIRCSPKSVNLKARDININGYLYFLTSSNCHKWATKLANKLGIQLRHGMEQYIPPGVSDFIDLCHAIIRIGAGNVGQLSVASSASLNISGVSLAVGNAGRSIQASSAASTTFE